MQFKKSISLPVPLELIDAFCRKEEVTVIVPIWHGLLPGDTLEWHEVGGLLTGLAEVVSSTVKRGLTVAIGDDELPGAEVVFRKIF